MNAQSEAESEQLCQERELFAELSEAVGEVGEIDVEQEDLIKVINRAIRGHIAIDNRLDIEDPSTALVELSLDVHSCADAAGDRLRSCVICGGSLSGRRADARHCGGPCRAEASRLRRILDGVGAPPYSSIYERLDAYRASKAQPMARQRARTSNEMETP